MCTALFAVLVSAFLIDSTPVFAEDASLDLAQYHGKVVVLDFWASWCVPCRRSFPWLNDMHRKYEEEGLVIVGVNLDLEREEAKQFLQEFPPDFQIYFDESKDVAKEFDVIAMPSSYLIGRDGEVVKRHFGFKVMKQDEYEAAIIAALRE
jgi:cytochrome c biogenesis protein CcmG/thiol:disulfide interchange protein DsbE